jgi:NAD(P) transhydrogenase subunit alpha
MYARNVTAFLRNFVTDGKADLNQQDPIMRDTLLTHRGEVINVQVRELLGLSNPPTPTV